MTVPDVAIEEPEKSKSTPTKAPPHMATTDLAQEKREFEVQFSNLAEYKTCETNRATPDIEYRRIIY